MVVITECYGKVTRSVKTEPCQGGMKPYLWQPVITSPVVQNPSGVGGGHFVIAVYYRLAINLATVSR